VVVFLLFLLSLVIAAVRGLALTVQGLVRRRRELTLRDLAGAGMSSGRFRGGDGASSRRLFPAAV
jgi:hypothetical protein